MQKYKFNYTFWDLCNVILLLLIARQLINIHVICLKQLQQIAVNIDYSYSWLKIYTKFNVLIWASLIAVISYYAKKNRMFLLGAILLISTLVLMILLYYIQPYQLWDMLLGYKFVPISQP